MIKSKFFPDEIDFIKANPLQRDMDNADKTYCIRNKLTEINLINIISLKRMKSRVLLCDKEVVPHFI